MTICLAGVPAILLLAALFAPPAKAPAKAPVKVEPAPAIVYYERGGGVYVEQPRDTASLLDPLYTLPDGYHTLAGWISLATKAESEAERLEGAEALAAIAGRYRRGKVDLSADDRRKLVSALNSCARVKLTREAGLEGLEHLRQRAEFDRVSNGKPAKRAKRR
jgi:hypothetical protein